MPPGASTASSSPASLPSRSSVVAVAAMFAGAVIPVYVAGWPQPDRIVEYAALVLAAILASALRMQQAASKDRAIMPPAFVVTISALLLFGSDVALLVAFVGGMTAGLAAFERGYPRSWILIEPPILLTATYAAGLAWHVLGGGAGRLVWPQDGVAIAGAVIGYCLAQAAVAAAACRIVRTVAARAEEPADLLAVQPARMAFPVVAVLPSFSTPRLRALSIVTMLATLVSPYLAGAGVAAVLVELIVRGRWEALPLALLTLLCGARTYADYLARLEEEQRRREVVGSLDHGMAVVGGDGRITVWNDALERMLGCSRQAALWRTLADALPPLGRTELPRAIRETLEDGRPRTLPQLALPSGGDVRMFEVRIRPVAGGVAVLWQDTTERAQTELELKRSGERLALAAEAANDGLWQWDLRSQEFYVSGRWRAMMGLPARAGLGRPEEWLERVHPEDIADLKGALEAHLTGRTDVFQHEHRLRHEDGTYRRVLCRGLAVKDGGRRRERIAGSLTDTTEQAIAQERLRSVGFLDPLTGLFNRAVFVEGLGRRLDEFKLRRVGSWFAVLYLDLDRFKIVNDSLGHLVGDELLIAVSRRLEACLRPGDALARLGGDEFAILLNGLAYDAQANAIALRIQEALSTPFSIGGREVFTSASIGIAFGPAHYTNPDEIMRDADTAMYHAKARGKARHEVFDDDMHARVRDRLSLENDLRRAIASHDFEVYYQPIVSLTSGMCVGFESLVRWTRNGEAVSPATFIPLAEELGLIEPLGTWVLQEACRTFAAWQRRFPAAGLECITVNVSSRQLVQQNFPRLVQQAVKASRLRPADLRVEITETALLDNPGEAAGVLQELRRFGVKVYLDDFGTGYSSLSHLHKLPVDALKIDRSFVRSLLLPDRPAIVESILALARTLNTSVVAEGIETEVQARELERLGCTHAQGFLFSRPLPASSAEHLLLANQPLGPKHRSGTAAPLPGPRGSAAAPVPVHAPRAVAPAGAHAAGLR